MKNVKLGLIAVAVAGVVGAGLASAQRSGGSAPPPPGPPGPAPTQPGTASQGTQGPAGMTISATTPDEVLRDVERTFGFVPQFIRIAPDALLPGFWASLKGLQMNPATQLDGKTKELIGLAVASTIPCEYCVYFHTAAARKNGATDQEIKEAIGMASVTRMASTMLNGNQVDRTAFRKDTDRMLRGEMGRSHARRSAAPSR